MREPLVFVAVRTIVVRRAHAAVRRLDFGASRSDGGAGSAGWNQVDGLYLRQSSAGGAGPQPS